MNPLKTTILKTIFLNTFILLSFSSNIFGQTPELALVGQWKGNVTHLGKDLSIQVDIGFDEGKLNGTVSIPDSGLFSLPISIKFENSKVQLSHFLSSSIISYQGILFDKQINGICEGFKENTTFNIKQISSNPTFFKTEEVQVKSGNFDLFGTLVKPNSPSKDYPVIIFIHGSGNQTRSRSAYRSLAYFFASRGIAGLVFDRQGQGKSTGDKRRLLKMTSLADDVLAWVKYLKEHNFKMIGLHGLSQGGWVVPIVVSLSDKVSFAIIDSAAGISVEEQNLYLSENLLQTKYSVSGENLKSVMKLLKEISEFNMFGKGDKNLIEAKMQRFRNESWFDNFFSKTGELTIYDSHLKEASMFNPISYWEKVRIPVYGVWGAEDSVVPPTKSRNLIEKALKKAGNKNYTFKVIPNAEHAMILKQQKDEAWDWNRFAPFTLDQMADWVLKNFPNIKKQSSRSKDFLLKQD